MELLEITVRIRTDEVNPRRWEEFRALCWQKISSEVKELAQQWEERMREDFPGVDVKVISPYLQFDALLRRKRQ